MIIKFLKASTISLINIYTHIFLNAQAYYSTVKNFVSVFYSILYPKSTLSKCK